MKKTLWFIILGFMLPTLALAQGAEERKKSRVYKPPAREEWMAAGLDPIEYDIAVRYEATLEDWKKMDSSRKTNNTAGWALIGVGLLTPAIEATIMFGGDVRFNRHPEQEIYIIVSVAAGICILTGIILVATAPGPEDMKEAWMRKQSQVSYYVAPSFGGAVFGFKF